ncbi:MAG: hypothetical protein MJ014_01990 [Methanocorpusculum sp.]|nr:hypothetical protein [Methanocorpusculum sp.]
MYPLLVLARGCCYGVLSVIVKLAYAQGYMVVSQYLSGWVILGVFLLILSGLQRKKAFSLHLRALHICAVLRFCWSPVWLPVRRVSATTLA